MSVRFALLALLREGPKHGFQLRQEFEAGTGEVWPLNVGQVYTTLQRLERDGLVECDGGEDDRSQRPYRITAAGEEELAEWLRTPPDANGPPRDELVIKVLIALRVAWGDIGELLQVHRRQLVEQMQEYTRLKEDLSDGEIALALVVDAELFRIDGIIRWLDAADGRLKRRQTDGPLPGGTPTQPERLRRRIGVRR
jgi:DNA-binding PadR family transcriptional regulator